MLTRADKFLIIFICLLAVGGIIYELKYIQHERAVLQISVDGQSRQFSLLNESVFAVDGVSGELQIEIKEGKARVQQAVCPDHVCEKTGWISRAPQRIICVPNKVVVSVIADNTDVDVIIQ